MDLEVLSVWSVVDKISICEMRRGHGQQSLLERIRNGTRLLGWPYLIPVSFHRVRTLH